jgi:hypothetical protein
MRPSIRRAALALMFGALFVVGLYVSIDVPVLKINTEGQVLVLGVSISPPPTGVCATFGCHCLVRESLSAWLSDWLEVNILYVFHVERFRIGYFQFLGCP